MGQRHPVRGRRTAAATWLLLTALACSVLHAHGAISAPQSNLTPWNAKLRALLALDPTLGRENGGSQSEQQNPVMVSKEPTVQDQGLLNGTFKHRRLAEDEAAAREIRAAKNLNGTHPVDPAAAAAAVTCKPSGIAMAVVALHGDTLKDHLMRWMAVANQNAYSAQHGYKVYVNVAPLHATRLAVWQKFLLAKAAMEHSCPEYVWLLDSDAYIMNLKQSVQKALKEVFDLPPDERPDVIVAKDCNGLNAGSLLLRNTPWARQHLSDAWATTDVYMSKDWHEQAALMHLTQDSTVEAHYHYVKQRTINAYPDSVECSDEGGPYQEGDLVLHFVDTAKHRVLMDSQWLGQVPIDPLEGKPSPVAYGVWPAATAPPRLKSARRKNVTSRVKVTMSSVLDEKESLSEEFLVVREPFDGNPGWPLRVPKLLRSIQTATRKHRPSRKAMFKRR